MGVEEYTLEALSWAAPLAGTMGQIQLVVAAHFGVKQSELASADRHKSVALARHVAMYLCKKRLGASFPEVGRAFGGRDHTTAMNAVRKVAHLLEVDLTLVRHLEAIERELERTS